MRVVTLHQALPSYPLVFNGANLQKPKDFQSEETKGIEKGDLSFVFILGRIKRLDYNI